MRTFCQVMAALYASAIPAIWYIALVCDARGYPSSLPGAIILTTMAGVGVGGHLLCAHIEREGR